MRRIAPLEHHKTTTSCGTDDVRYLRAWVMATSSAANEGVSCVNLLAQSYISAGMLKVALADWAPLRIELSVQM